MGIIFMFFSFFEGLEPLLTPLHPWYLLISNKLDINIVKSDLFIYVLCVYRYFILY
jgi:hypothetical protein